MILVIGASGYIGWYLTAALAERDAVVATYRSNPIVPKGDSIRAVRLDACDRDQVRAILSDRRPETIVNLAAATMPDWCETHRPEAYKANVRIPENLVAFAGTCNARIVHLSTCYVFPGDLPLGSPGYREADVPAPVNYYGLTKLIGERVIQGYPRGIVCRLTHVFGPRLNHHEPNIFTKYYDDLDAKRPVAVLGKPHVIKPLYIKDAVDFLERIVGSDLQSGLFHCAGLDSLTKVEFARKMCDTWGFDPSLIVPAATGDKRAKRPTNSCLDITRAISTLGFHPRTVDEALQDIKKSDQRNNESFHEVLI